MSRMKLLADANLLALSQNPYPGRGIVVGLDETGENLVHGYWLMGRSEKSRNRILSCEGGRLFTEFADPSKVKDGEDTSLVIYNAMRVARDCAVVSNGHQTDDVAQKGMISLGGYIYEPDAPNFTPRITACSFWNRAEGTWRTTMSILRKSPWIGSSGCHRHLYGLNDMGRGFGHCITTYSGDGDPLPAFQGEPYLLSLEGDAPTMAAKLWEALNAENRVSLAVKFIPISGPSHITIINKYEKVEA